MLAALIAAVRDAEDGSGLVAGLPVAGLSLVERQVRLAVAAGAAHCVVLVERLPAGLTAAIDRLRRDGVAVEVARSARDGADRFHPEERVLVFADGALPALASIERVAGCAAPVLLTLGEAEPPGPFERIDANARWSGLALVSGDQLRRTVAMLGDWDLHSTLLRRAVGASARRIDVADGADTGRSQPVFLVRSRAGARAAAQASLAVRMGDRPWAERLVHGPLARALVPTMLDRPVSASALRWGAVGMTLAAVPCAWLGWLLAGLVALFAGGVLDALGRRLAAIRLGATGAVDRAGPIRVWAMALGLAAFAAHRLDRGAAPAVLAAAIVLTVAAGARERHLLRRWAARAAPGWAADADALVLLFAAFAAANLALPGLYGLAAYAAASFAAIQDRLGRTTAPDAASRTTV